VLKLCIIDDLAYICKKNPMNKKLASQQYAANQMGMADRKRPKKSGDGEGMSCSKEGCGAYNSGSGRSGVGEKTNRQNKGGAKGLSSRPQYASKIVNKERAAKKMERVRADIKKANTPKKMKAKF
jgi:hypothetical protein